MCVCLCVCVWGLCVWVCLLACVCECVLCVRECVGMCVACKWGRERERKRVCVCMCVCVCVIIPTFLCSRQNCYHIWMCDVLPSYSNVRVFLGVKIVNSIKFLECTAKVACIITEFHYWEVEELDAEKYHSPLSGSSPQRNSVSDLLLLLLL